MDVNQQKYYERKVNDFLNSHRTINVNATFDHELIFESDFNEEIENQIGFQIINEDDVLFILRWVKRDIEKTIDDIKKEFMDKDFYFYSAKPRLLVLTAKKHS